MSFLFSHALITFAVSCILFCAECNIFFINLSVVSWSQKCFYIIFVKIQSLAFVNQVPQLVDSFIACILLVLTNLSLTTKQTGICLLYARSQNMIFFFVSYWPVFFLFQNVLIITLDKTIFQVQQRRQELEQALGIRNTWRSLSTKHPPKTEMKSFVG